MEVQCKTETASTANSLDISPKTALSHEEMVVLIEEVKEEMIGTITEEEEMIETDFIEVAQEKEEAEVVLLVKEEMTDTKTEEMIEGMIEETIGGMIEGMTGEMTEGIILRDSITEEITFQETLEEEKEEIFAIIVKSQDTTQKTAKILKFKDLNLTEEVGMIDKENVITVIKLVILHLIVDSPNKIGTNKTENQGQINPLLHLRQTLNPEAEVKVIQDQGQDPDPNRDLNQGLLHLQKVKTQVINNHHHLIARKKHNRSE